MAESDDFATYFVITIRTCCIFYSFTTYNDYATMKIHDLCPDERPREKLLARGASSLSDGELLAILLRSGTKNANVLDVARDLLKVADGKLTALARMSSSSLAGVDGIGLSKVATLQAAFELGRRLIDEGNGIVRTQIREPEAIYSIMIPRLKGLMHEECWVLFLDRAHHVIAREMLTSGGHTSTVIDNRMVIRRALELHADALVLVHNHPSGNPMPGKADVEMTGRLKKAASQFDISLIDHVVIADSSYFSFANESVVDVHGGVDHFKAVSDI